MKQPLVLLLGTLCLASASFAGTADAPVLLSYNFGGGGGLVQMGSASQGMRSGIVVGQSIASTPILAEDDDLGMNSYILPGFWIEAQSDHFASAIDAAPQIPMAKLSVSATFLPGLARVQFDLPKAAEASVRILDLQGRQLTPAWNGHMSAGKSQVDISLLQLGSQPMFMLIQAGSQQKSYRFIPNVGR